MAEKLTIVPVTYLPASNLGVAFTTTFDFERAAVYQNVNATAYPNGIDTAKWGGFACHINVLSYDGTPTLFFKIQHSAVDPSSVSYDPWVDLIKFPPITTVGVFSVECPNESVRQFGRWVRVVHCQFNDGAEAATIGDIVFGARE